MQLHRSTALLAALAVLALLPAPTGAASGDEDLSGSGSGSELAPTPSPSTPAVTLTTTTTVPAVTVATVTTETTVTNTTATTVTTTTAITITTAPQPTMKSDVVYFGPYPESGFKPLVGSVQIVATKAQLTIKGVLTGLPKTMTAGFHIHDGSGCALPSQVGKHWFAEGQNLTDPWTSATYTSDETGSAVIDITMTVEQLGFDPRGNLNHTVVVHSTSNKSSMVNCGVIQRPTTPPKEVTTTAITITTQTTTTSSTTTSSTTVSTTTTVSATCHAGHFLNTTANKCEPCPDNTYQDEDEDHTLTVCMPWVKCEPGQKVATPPTAVSQVTCYAAPSGVTKENPLGQPGTICGPTQFVDSVVPDDGGSASGFGSNLIDDAPVVCAYQEKCPKGFAVFLAASPTSQVECTDCKLKGEFYSDEQNAPFCKPWSTCPKDTKWKQPSGSATQDIDCVACEAGLWQPMENSRSTKCQHTTTPAPTTPTIPVDGSGSGSDNAMPDTTTAKGGLSLMILIAICAGGTILLLGLGLVVKRSCRRKASYLTANEWSDSGRSWRGDYNDDADDETLLGGL